MSWSYLAVVTVQDGRTSGGADQGHRRVILPFPSALVCSIWFGAFGPLLVAHTGVRLHGYV